MVRPMEVPGRQNKIVMREDDRQGLKHTSSDIGFPCERSASLLAKIFEGGRSWLVAGKDAAYVVNI
jgi:hypothetical protein